MKEDPNLHKTKTILAYSILLLIFICLIMLFVLGIPRDNKDLVIFIVGAICAYGSNVISSFFGTNEKKKENEKDN